MPLTKSVPDNIKELYDSNKTKSKGKKRGRKQIVAIAFSGARRSGNRGN